ncbi:hypothetical protein RJ55_03720 [Drechmeria coniospora]|nr:hypothetical protein RJ55_03720 [Drechmeria coniospora]
MKVQQRDDNDDNETVPDIVDPDNSFDASRVDPSKFTRLSKLASVSKSLDLAWKSRVARTAPAITPLETMDLVTLSLVWAKTYSLVSG